MDITPLIAADKKIITGYGNKVFIVNNIKIESSILITPDKVVSLKLTNLNDVTIDDFKALYDSEEEILLLLGCGNKYQTTKQELYYSLKKNYPKIKIETMLTNAACRTYNVLLAEGRNIAALLIANEI